MTAKGFHLFLNVNMRRMCGSCLVTWLSALTEHLLEQLLVLHAEQRRITTKTHCCHSVAPNDHGWRGEGGGVVGEGGV